MEFFEIDMADVFGADNTSYSSSSNSGTDHGTKIAVCSKGDVHTIYVARSGTCRIYNGPVNLQTKTAKPGFNALLNNITSRNRQTIK